jgi:nucleoid-associated protein YgaU
MKKLIALIFAGTLCLASAAAQNFADNENQKAGREYERQATEAMAAGDYEKSAKLADLAAIEYRKSREYAGMMLLKFRAANAINLTQSAITDIANSKAAKKYPTELANAKKLLADARDLFKAEKWEDSRSKALESIDALRGIKGEAPSQSATTGSIALPKYYTVVSRPQNTDCFWNIAKMPAIYGDPLLWEKLWRANVGKMRDPKNPDLIYPGMVIEIPPVANETREGTYDPAKTYPSLK